MIIDLMKVVEEGWEMGRGWEYGVKEVVDELGCVGGVGI